MSKSYDTAKQKEKTILCMVALTREDNIEEDLSELKNLAEACDSEVVGRIFQTRSTPDLSFLIGTGKVEEIKDMIKKTNADLVIFDNQLSGSKINNLEKELGCRVIDRAMLILDIFAKRALSNEGKLQVELAQLKYSLPRLSGLSGTSGRYGSGGVGMRGPGETKLELDRRIIEDRIVEKQKELRKLKEERDLRREKRVLSKKKLVAFVGYTNSGKSTLLNTFTKANVLVKDMLFATLDTTTRSLWLGPNRDIMVVDTVGFVNKLPHELVEAFSSTLEEVTYADMLVHVVDISNPEHAVQERVVLKVLEELGAKDTPMITVYNKADRIFKTAKIPARNVSFYDSQSKNKERSDVDDKPSSADVALNPDALYISAKNNENIDILKEEISIRLFGEIKDEW